MLNDNIRLAQKIVSNSSSNIISNRPYHEHSFIYKTTNEDVSIYQHLFNNKNSLMSVIGSGDQILNAILAGIYDIHCCDISVFPKYFLELKVAAIKALSQEEYMLYFFGVLNEESYEKVRCYLNNDALKFWDSLYNFFDDREIYNSTLFSSEPYNVNVQVERNLYLRKYEVLKNNIEKVRLQYHEGNIYDVLNNSKDKYDIVNLSSVIYYNQELRNNYKTFLNTITCLEDNAIVLSYLYNINQQVNDSLNNYFYEDSFSLEATNNDGVLIYKRK